MREPEWIEAARAKLTHGETLEVGDVDGDGMRTVRVWPALSNRWVSVNWPDAEMTPLWWVALIECLAEHLRNPPPPRPTFPFTVRLSE